MKISGITALCAALAAAASAQEPSTIDSTALGTTTAFTLLAPRVVSPKVASFEWSPDGRRLLVWLDETEVQLIARGLPGSPRRLAIPQGGRPSIATYDLDTRRLAIRWQQPAGMEFGGSAWESFTDTLFVVVVNPNDGTAELIAERGGAWQRLDPVTAGVHYDVEANPHAPVVVVRRSQNDKVQLLLWKDGKVEPISLPAGTTARYARWRDAGTLVAFGRQGDKRTIHLVDIATRSVQAFTGSQDDLWPSNPVLPLRTDWAVLRSENPPGETKGTWLYADDPSQPPALITPEGFATLAPGLAAVAYQAQGTLFVRPIVQWPRAEFEQAAEVEFRVRAMTQAKQIGLAMHILAVDSDDMLPPANSDWAERLRPYLKSLEGLAQFSYVFPGGKVGDVEKPSETVLGYYVTPYGTAVVYVDTSVKWEPNK